MRLMYYSGWLVVSPMEIIVSNRLSHLREVWIGLYA